jgi:hypothetical protein
MEIVVGNMRISKRGLNWERVAWQAAKIWSIANLNWLRVDIFQHFIGWSA